MPLYKQKNSKVWWVNIRHAGGRVRRPTGETDRAAAQKRHNEIQVELWAQVPAARGRTWGQAVIAWTEVETRSDSELLSLSKFATRYRDRPLDEYEGFTWHGLRHTRATWHKQNGTPDEALQELGAWKDPRMVKNYAHHAPGFAAGYANNTKDNT